jgi:hypothetical protein
MIQATRKELNSVYHYTEKEISFLKSKEKQRQITYLISRGLSVLRK